MMTDTRWSYRRHRWHRLCGRKWGGEHAGGRSNEGEPKSAGRGESQTEPKSMGPTGGARTDTLSETRSRAGSTTFEKGDAIAQRGSGRDGFYGGRGPSLVGWCCTWIGVCTRVMRA